jgi:hypothetical protein
MTLQRTPEGYQNLGTQLITAAGGTVAIPVGAVFVSTDNNTALTLPTADAIGGSMLVISNIDAVATPGLTAAAGDTVDGAASILMTAATTFVVVRSGPTTLLTFAFA